MTYSAKNYDYRAFDSEFKDELRVARLETALGLQPPVVEYVVGGANPTSRTPTGRGVHVPDKCTPACVEAWTTWEDYRDSLRGRAAQLIVVLYSALLCVLRAL